MIDVFSNIPKRKRKKAYQEHTHQANFFEWLSWAHPKYFEVCFSIPNEGKRSRVQGAILKRRGLKAGVPDVFCAIPNQGKHGLFIEFKANDGALTDKQAFRIPLLAGMNYACHVCYSSDEAIGVFTDYISK